MNQIQSPAEMGVPLKFELIADPELLCAIAFLPMPDAATRPMPIADRLDTSEKTPARWRRNDLTLVLLRLLGAEDSFRHEVS